MDSTVLYGVVAVPAIVGLVQVVKDLGVPGSYAPACAVLFGVLFGFAQLYAQSASWIQATVVGVALGLSAVGLYTGTKTVIQNVTFAPKAAPIVPDSPATPTPPKG